MKLLAWWNMEFVVTYIFRPLSIISVWFLNKLSLSPFEVRAVFQVFTCCSNTPDYLLSSQLLGVIHFMDELLKLKKVGLTQMHSPENQLWTNFPLCESGFPLTFTFCFLFVYLFCSYLLFLLLLSFNREDDLGKPYREQWVIHSCFRE